MHVRLLSATLCLLSVVSFGAAADAVELSGRYEYRTDAQSKEIIGDAVCFFPDRASIPSVPRPALTNRTTWFCFSATPRARAAFSIPEAPSPCGYAGTGKVIVNNYKPYLGEGDGHDIADLVRVISSEPATALRCDALNASGHAQSQPILSTTGAFFALSVADIRASGTWYAEKLGLKVTMPPQRSGPGQAMVLEGGGLIVELVQHDEAVPLARLTPVLSDSFKVHGFFKAGVIVDDVDKTLAMLEARGVPVAFGPFAAKEGRRANFIIRDNAGNLLHFFGK